MSVGHRIKLLEGTGLRASARGNYLRSIVKLIEYVKDSPAKAFGISGFKCTNDQDSWLRRALESWKPRLRELVHIAKREAAAQNTQELYQSKQRWATVAEITAAANARILPVLQRMSQKTALDEADRVTYTKLLLVMMMVGRGGRGGSFAGAYVYIAIHKPLHWI